MHCEPGWDYGQLILCDGGGDGDGDGLIDGDDRSFDLDSDCGQLILCGDDVCDRPNDHWGSRSSGYGGERSCDDDGDDHLSWASVFF